MAKRYPGLKVGNWVRIFWHDAASHDEGWSSSAEIENSILPCITVGIVIKRDRHQVVLAMSKGVAEKPDDETFATTWSIPLGWVQRIEVWPLQQ